MDTIETGRVYLFSRQFLEEFPRRFTGPRRLRFIVQPMFAILLGVRGDLADAQAGTQLYLFGLHLRCWTLVMRFPVRSFDVDLSAWGFHFPECV